MGVLVRLIKRMNEALGITSIVVSNDVTESASIADYVYVLSAGHIVGAGTPRELQQTDSKWVRQFMEALPDGPVPFHYPAADYDNELLSGHGNE